MKLNRSFAILTLRLVLGFVFLMQGFGKVFTMGIENIFNSAFFYEAYKDLLPELVIYATAYYTSYIELIGGLLLVIGFKRDYALYALASVLVIVTFGHGLIDFVWNLSNVMFRMIPLVALLLLPKKWDRFSIDRWLVKRRKK